MSQCGWSRPAAVSEEKLNPVEGKSELAGFLPAHCSSLNGFSSSGLPESCCPTRKKTARKKGVMLQDKNTQNRTKFGDNCSFCLYDFLQVFFKSYTTI